MKKLMFVAVAALSTAAFAYPDPVKGSDVAEGYYDLSLTTKHLAHAEKSKKVTLKKNRNEAGASFEQRCRDLVAEVESLPGYEWLDYPEWQGKGDQLSKITFEYSYFDFKVDKNGVTNMVTKVISKTSNGVYDSITGKVYLWDKADKVVVRAGEPDVIAPSDTDRQGNERDQKGYKAYEVPLALHNQFIKTDDNKAAGGFTGENATAKDGKSLNFTGLTAFGTGTYDAKKGYVKTVAGNIAGKYKDDLRFGCYGTWKLNKITKDYGDGEVIENVLVDKGCVELVNERD